MGIGTRILAIVSFVIFLAALLTYIIAVGTPWWWTASDNVAVGLWQGCGRLTKESDWECDGIAISDQSDETKATIAMVLLGGLVCVPCLICYIIALCQDLSLIIACVLCMCGGACNLIAVAVYGSQFSDIEYVGWSYALACVSCGGFILNGLITLLLKICC